ncbi:hypothetical protein C2845_PM03G22730 [Panicum miliaceum]|uniref:F-box associated beta-propeller type 3 domain-containing protein n=1 Tax=Panicum miliaceum TaxID=4540 RepID=A0A3L6T5W4_PANMI|nr:hypothetical protein C2845_PM03G22730 [Panicum miliaceum]
MDLSGRVVKRVRRTSGENEWVLFIQQDLVATLQVWRDICYRLLNPANGAVHALPERLAEEHANMDIRQRDYSTVIIFGLVASTGEYKVLRVLDCISYREQLCEVFTLDGSNSSRWRGKKAPPGRLEMRQSGVVINGIVYLFSAPRRIASFDLETEEWRATLQGPQINLVGDAARMLNNQMAALSGSLVVVHYHHPSMDLWFLIDLEKQLWVKQHSINVNLSVMHPVKLNICPLLVLNDGRIVTYIDIGTRGLLRIYNPRTSTYTDVAEIGTRDGIGLYTGNLLSSANGAN